MSIIQVSFIAGRTDEQKERLIGALTDAVVDTIGLDRSDVRVILRDIPNTEYGIAGKTAKSLGRGVGRQPAKAKASFSKTGIRNAPNSVAALSNR
ncbi:MAG TPA: 2-hydroxymuconate tautomerase family protein [Herbaspirillum sp.]|jgi:4-oxalocrotonate tautomerase